MSYVGMGLYPGDACYDPNRPSWLPYWIADTQEDECQTGTSSVLGLLWNDITNPGGVVEGAANSTGEAAGTAAADVANAAASGASAAGQTLSSSLTGGGWGIALIAIALGVFLIGGALKR